jgi:hypothetical protein
MAMNSGTASATKATDREKFVDLLNKLKNALDEYFFSYRSFRQKDWKKQQQIIDAAWEEVARFYKLADNQLELRLAVFQTLVKWVSDDSHVGNRYQQALIKLAIKIDAEIEKGFPSRTPYYFLYEFVKVT